MVDSEPLWFEVEKAFLAARGGTFTRAMADACVGRGLAATLRTMREAYEFDLDVVRDGAEVVDRFIARVGELKLMPGCLELLDAARGNVGLALASSSSRRLVDAVVARFELGQWLDVVVGRRCRASETGAGYLSRGGAAARGRAGRRDRARRLACWRTRRARRRDADHRRPRDSVVRVRRRRQRTSCAICTRHARFSRGARPLPARNASNGRDERRRHLPMRRERRVVAAPVAERFVLGC